MKGPSLAVSFKHACARAIIIGTRPRDAVAVKSGGVTIHDNRTASTLAPVAILDKLLPEFRLTVFLFFSRGLVGSRAACHAKYEKNYRREHH